MWRHFSKWNQLFAFVLECENLLTTNPGTAFLPKKHTLSSLSHTHTRSISTQTHTYTHCNDIHLNYIGSCVVRNWYAFLSLFVSDRTMTITFFTPRGRWKFEWLCLFFIRIFLIVSFQKILVHILRSGEVLKSCKSSH